MRFLLLSLVLLAGAAHAVAADPAFPGLKSILTADEWKRAGLDRLTPEQVALIDAAIIRNETVTTTQLKTDLAEARETVAAAKTELTEARETVATAKTELAQARETVAATKAEHAETKQGLLQRFGLPVFNDAVWRSVPPLKARVVKWESANRFLLDNDQAWEGNEPITYELVGKNIEIQARPSDQYALVIEGVNTKLRVRRVR